MNINQMVMQGKKDIEFIDKLVASTHTCEICEETEEHEHVCDECNGTGTVEISVEFNGERDGYALVPCDCQGLAEEEGDDKYY